MFKQNPLAIIRYTSKYGPRVLPGRTSFHKGVDLGAKRPGITGDECYATDDGVVKFAGINSGGVAQGYGYYIIIEHTALKRCTLYGHLKSLEVKVGQVVKAGQVVAHMGNTGSSTGAHLHFEVRNVLYPKFWSDGTWIDPEPLMLTVVNAIEIPERRIVQEKTDFSDETMAFFDKHPYPELLYKKLVEKLR